MVKRALGPSEHSSLHMGKAISQTQMVDCTVVHWGVALGVETLLEPPWMLATQLPAQAGGR